MCSRFDGGVVKPYDDAVIVSVPGGEHIPPTNSAFIATRGQGWRVFTMSPFYHVSVSVRQDGLRPPGAYNQRLRHVLSQSRSGMLRKGSEIFTMTYQLFCVFTREDLAHCDVTCTSSTCQKDIPQGQPDAQPDQEDLKEANDVAGNVLRGICNG